MKIKKIFCSLVILLFLFSITPIFSQEHNLNKAKKDQKEESSIIPWVWLGINVAATGLTTYFIINGLNAKSDYENQLSLIDNTTMENYNKLLNIKKDAEGKLNLAIYLGIGTGISTLANIVFWNAFNEKEKKFSLQYEPLRNAYVLAVNREF